jgi:PTS system N-acetylglucosamine-specific IIB component
MSQAEQVLAGLGGGSNLLEIEGCTTRLCAELRDVSLVDETALDRAGAHGVIRTGPMVQVVMGPGADALASDIEDLV